MIHPTRALPLLALLAAAVVVTAQEPQAPASQQPAPQQPASIGLSLRGDSGTPPRLAVPDFLVAAGDREAEAAAKTIAEVLWADLDFEREFYMIPRDTYRSIPKAPSVGAPPFDRWRELGADGVVIGLVQKTGGSIRVEVRLFNIRARQEIHARE
ncbi:MAG: hypothetical protein AB7N90_18920, partial [Vicinamibacterales bacterium]